MYVSDTISIVEFAAPSHGGSNTDVLVVNAYGPTSQHVCENPAFADHFYEELESVTTSPARFQLFVCGNFTPNWENEQLQMRMQDLVQL